MPKAPVHDGPDLFDLLDEVENGPPACTHVSRVGKGARGWTHERDPSSPYFMEWVDSDPSCRRSARPGTHKQPFSTVGWSRELQKDVTLCPSGETCVRELEWGHPCDRDESFTRHQSCERLNA